MPSLLILVQLIICFAATAAAAMPTIKLAVETTPSLASQYCGSQPPDEVDKVAFWMTRGRTHHTSPREDRPAQRWNAGRCRSSEAVRREWYTERMSGRRVVFNARS
jgi:hypothetical protein